MHAGNTEEPQANFGLPVRLPCSFDDRKKNKGAGAALFFERTATFDKAGLRGNTPGFSNTASVLPLALHV
jgi:hypothetical protein